MFISYKLRVSYYPLVNLKNWLNHLLVSHSILPKRVVQHSEGTQVILNDGSIHNVNSEIHWSDHGNKHFPPPRVSWGEVIEDTITGFAKYKMGINIEAIERYAWHFGQDVKTGKTWRVFKFNEVIGAKKGKETCYVRVECTSGNIIHGHPIPEEEYNKLLKGKSK
ncbi:hypothetical protein [Lysinibacillus fusiformis]|uniref:hypothetical protein n=1 Tax=Lysinibacillus fusiformis TaxID=28031 RepID=UPI0018E64021|nr:hypothetical protein [Lysinibacillus fusiformis]MBI6865705.1 hypothetical protein [Lysinibacillus fusiformis]